MTRVSAADTSLVYGGAGGVGAFGARITHEPEQTVRRFFARGRLMNVVGRVLPVAEAVELHRLVKRAIHKGKILLAG